MNIKGLLFVCALLSVAVFSCKKDDDGLEASMSATIADVTISETDTTETSSSVFNYISRYSFTSNGVLSITGTSILGDVITIQVNGIEEGTYVLNTVDILNAEPQCGCELYASYYDINAAVTKKASFFANIGKVVLTKVDKEHKLISGSFEFYVKSTIGEGAYYKSVRNGSFENLKYAVK